MIDSITALAFSIASSPGRYALLLGSGISRAAAIMTGWEITLDLVRKLAATNGETFDNERGMLAWYKDKFGKEPDYSEIIEMLAPYPADRQALLRSYFEPDYDDREHEKKIPTKAHRAIAELIASGAVKVVLTTNFDRLLEQALTDTGVHADVVSTADAISGAVPITHCNHRIIKLHGDYLDTRIKNTTSELASYDTCIDVLLDRILDEFGLIVCGWSGNCDTALVGAVKRAPNRRYPMYWVSVGGLDATAQDLVNLRGADVVTTTGADEFFPELSARVDAIKEAQRPHPLTGITAVELVKKYVASPVHRIHLHDMVIAEADRVRENFINDRLPFNSNSTQDDTKRHVESYESLTTVLTAMLLNGIYWGESSHDDLWAKAIVRIALPSSNNGVVSTGFQTLQTYPAILALYASTLSSVASRKYGVLGKLADIAVDVGLVPQPFYQAVSVARLKERWADDSSRWPPPISERLYTVFHDRCNLIAVNRQQYDYIFDSVEYLLALLTYWQSAQNGYPTWHIGYFGRRMSQWKGQYRNPGASAIREQMNEQDSAILQSGLFDGSIETAKAAMDKLDNAVRASNAHR